MKMLVLVTLAKAMHFHPGIRSHYNIQFHQAVLNLLRCDGTERRSKHITIALPAERKAHVSAYKYQMACPLLIPFCYIFHSLTHTCLTTAPESML